jgi:predicted CoA-substrate-specific enzyme activase
MKINEIIGAAPWRYGPAQAVVGLDIGSRGSKGVLLKGNEIYTALIPTGLFMQETADEILGKLLAIAQLSRKDIGFIVGTGYGRISLKYDDIPYQVVTEISCHAMGVHAVVPQARTIIDIGGQDSKAIKIDPSTGKVVEFVMNDKCAAGTGRFLEKAANILGIDLSQLGEVAIQSKKPAQISSQCVVFAESEVISLRARGERSNDNEARADIAAGIHLSAARRVHNLLGRIGIEPGLVFSGGVSNNRGMWHTLEELLGAKFTPTKIDMIFAGALGAAVYAGKHFANLPKPAATITSDTLKLDLRQFTELINEEQQAVIDAKGVKKAGYLCNYTPLELLSAAGTRYSRLIKGGSSKTTTAGELYTQSVFCDFTKSCIGNFQEGDPLYKSFDRVYNFHTCANMKRATEVIESFVSTKLLNLPKLRDSQDAREFFRTEIITFKQDLEELTGRQISDDDVRAEIVRFNKIRRLYKRISELRKRAISPISGREYLDLVRGFFYLPADKLLRSLEQVYRHYQDLKPIAKKPGRPLRLMIAGSVVADGDRRLLNILEGEIGAQVVVEDHCAGLRPFYNTVPETGDPYLALANGYLDQAPCARMRPFDDAVDFSTKLAKEYDVDGVIYVFLKFCTCYGVSKKDYISQFQAQGLPVLEISSDYSESDHGQLKTRLEAFIEVLNGKVNTPTHEQLANA